jgi:starvation-inducible DNA-binding protein
MAQVKKTPALLSALLADTYALYLKTQNYHWNVTGPNFFSLHNLFDGQYNELAEAVDEIAERIRALGELAPGSFKDFSRLMSVSEAKTKTNALGMVNDLIKTHEAICKSISQIIEQTRKENDEGTQDLLINRLAAHEKMAWMLRSHL